VARIIIGSYIVRYPLGGNLSWALQWPVGFQQLGHEVYLVEKSGYSNSCFDFSRGVMSDDCTYGIAIVSELLKRFGLQNSWCYIDAQGRYYGLPRRHLAAIFKTADLFLDMGTHGIETKGTWLAEAANVGIRVLMGTEPGYTQMKMEIKLGAGKELPRYDFYYTTGRNIGTDKTTAPTAGRQWRPMFDPIDIAQFIFHPAKRHAPFTTVMNWQSHEWIEFNGTRYGQKDVEFVKFMDLPSRVSAPLELAVAGKHFQTRPLTEAGWRIRHAHEVTRSIDSFKDYIYASKGEFSVCKHACVAMNTGWFSDRSAAYLASGRPVIMQETGFSSHLPCGRGLFAVHTVEEAATAINQVNADYKRHSKWARDIAIEYLDTRKVLGRFLQEIGL
jgi:hypothetical protein